MRHLKSGRKLNRTASHRKAMLINLAVSLLDKERVKTTVAKAKEVRGVVERLITHGKKGTLHAIRLVARKIHNKNILKKLFEDIAPGYKDREGGYTRVMRLATRKGDNAELAIIELVGREGDVQRKRKKKKKTAVKKAKPAVKKTVDKKPEDAKVVAAETAEKKKKTTAPAKKKSEKAAEPEKKTPAPKAKKVAEAKEEKGKKAKAEKSPTEKEEKPKKSTAPKLKKAPERKKKEK